MEFNSKEIEDWDLKYKINFINSLSGYRPVHLIGTSDDNGATNVAIFNSITHIGANPPMLGFIMRPLTIERNTYNNIKETGVFTINHVHKSFLKKAHYTSAKLAKEQSEFDVCNLKKTYLKGFTAPFVTESHIKIGLKLVEDIQIESNGTRLIIGEIEIINIKKELIEENGQLDLAKSNNVCITGLNQYSSVSKFINYPYVRANEIPNFNKKERPDNVSFDEETQSYNANILPYGTNIGAPSIEVKGLTNWKNNSVNSFNHLFQDKIKEIKTNYQNLIDEYETNETIYNAKYSFEPIVGKTYHLYKSYNLNEPFLSIIPPQDWNKEHLGSYKLNHDKVWQKLTL